ncbi:hypothetical protein BT69DRAFT_1236244 [Atractiella rhizophila]|nr:hypothetical protein BT69DRAFT_1236244 [Atractiella rhizophila]
MAEHIEDFRKLVEKEYKLVRNPRAKVPKRKRTEQSDPWGFEAEKIAASLRGLETFLLGIRKAYLSSHGPGRGTGGGRVSGSVWTNEGEGFKEFEKIRTLTERERDEIDLQLKIGLKRGIERVRDLEKFENARQESVKQRVSPLSRFITLPPPSAQTDPRTLHRNSVTLYLNNKISHLSSLFRQLQEKRVEMQIAKSSSLGSSGSMNASKTQAPMTWNRTAPTSSSLPSLPEDANPLYYKPIDSLISAEQQQIFESETSELLKETQSTLNSIKTAQASLVEISDLQGQLAMHLAKQIEVGDKLWEEAVESSGKVDEGNKQLRKARERAKGGRIWVLALLLGASFTLLFLDYYTP